jgi:hypothetical protein
VRYVSKGMVGEMGGEIFFPVAGVNHGCGNN